MKQLNPSKLIIVLALTLAATLASAPGAQAASASEIRQKSRRALQSLYANNEGARTLGKQAKAVLFFQRS